MKHNQMSHSSARSPPEVSLCERRTSRNLQEIPSKTGKIFQCIKNDSVVRLEL